jgi:hypothetical protein
MPETTLYFEAITAQRFLLVDELTALEGTATISIETQGDMGPQEADLPIYVEDNFPEFLRNLRYLSKEDQELLLAYCVLGKTQSQLGAIMATQTQCSTDIRMAMRKVVDVQRAERDRSFEAGGFAVPGIEHGTRGRCRPGCPRGQRVHPKVSWGCQQQTGTHRRSCCWLYRAQAR